MLTTPSAQLLTKITERRARVAIIGLGYVGLLLVIAFAEAGFPSSASMWTPAKWMPSTLVTPPSATVAES